MWISNHSAGFSIPVSSGSQNVSIGGYIFSRLSSHCAEKWIPILDFIHLCWPESWCKNLFWSSHLFYFYIHIFLSQRETLQLLQAATFLCTTGRILPVAGFYWEPCTVSFLTLSFITPIISHMLLNNLGPLLKRMDVVWQYIPTVTALDDKAWFCHLTKIAELVLLIPHSNAGGGICFVHGSREQNCFKNPIMIPKEPLSIILAIKLAYNEAMHQVHPNK